MDWTGDCGPVLVISIQEREFFFCICHHIKERTLPFFGVERYLCARCLGVLLGMILGLVLYLAGIKIPLLVSLLFIIPLIIDGFTQLFEWRMSNNGLRLVTGILFSFGVIFLVQEL
jgi:uncharacterized membrane protein